MLVYFVSGAVALIAVCAAQAFEGSRRNVINGLWFVCFLALFIPAALRYDIGVDYSATMESAGYLGYYQLYQLYANQAPAPGMDLGFYALIRVLNLFSSNPQWMFASLSALSCGLTLRACRRLSDMPAFSVALFLFAGFYFESLNIARQWVAIACVLNGLEWAGGERGDLRSFVRYAVWVVAGSLMHMSCLIWLVVWPLFSLKMNVRRAVALALAFVALSFVAEKAACIVLAGTRFGLYLDPSSDVYVGPQPRLNAVITYGITWAFTVATLCGVAAGRSAGESLPGCSPASSDARCASGDDSQKASPAGLVADAVPPEPAPSSVPNAAPAPSLATRLGTIATRRDSSLVIIATIAFALFVSTFYLPHIVDRVARYFAPVLVLAMPRCLERISDLRLRRVALVVILVAWAAATYVQVIAGGQYGVVPYQSVFGERAVQGVLS